MEIGDWVRAARNHKGWSQAQLGDAVGRTKANVGHWETGKHAPSVEQAAQISIATGYPLPHLGAPELGNANDASPISSSAAPGQAKSHADNGNVVIAQFDVGGGMDSKGRLILEAEPPGIIKSWRVDREWLRLNVPVYTSIQNLCIVTGFGPSMKPMYNPGDPLLMDRGVHTIDQEGVYFFRVGDEGYIKLIQRVPEFEGAGYTLRVISKNPDFPPYDLSPKNPYLRVIGKILTAWKSEQF